jgi:hypothetical protein
MVDPDALGPGFLEWPIFDQPGVHSQQVGRCRAINLPRQGDRHAVLPADQRAGRLRPGGERVGETQHYLGALHGGAVPPGTAIQGGSGGRSSGVDVGLGTHGGLAERHLGGRLKRAVSLAALRLSPLTVDEEAGSVQTGMQWS